MKLSVGERYVLLDILPKEGTYSTLKILHSLKQNLSFNEEELAVFKIVETANPNGGVSVHWDSTVPQEAEVEIGEKATDLIVDSLKKLDQSGKLTDREFGLFSKFVEKE